MKLTGTVAIITGSSSGIEDATALDVAREGAFLGCLNLRSTFGAR
jgi:NAD(P)-dependent dehydrogenase (short-subunit alcohol dehydrogenase family)